MVAGWTTLRIWKHEPPGAEAVREMTTRKDLVPTAGEFLVFVADDGTAQVHVRIADGAVWLTQKQIAALYGKDVRTINEHLGHVYGEGELDPEATIRKFRIVRTEGNHSSSRQVVRVVEHYSLPAIIAVGYRVRSRGAVRLTRTTTTSFDLRRARATSHGAEGRS